jgi:hypothetical protein
MLEFGRTAGPARVTPAADGIALSPGRVHAAGFKAAVAGPDKHSFSFRDLLSDLNPLQYIPVIGTMFRAITGDVIPEPVRDVGSMVVSTLIGGPVGAALDLAELAAEKLTGIDPEKIGDKLLADVGIGHRAVVPAPAEQVAKTAPAANKLGAPIAWSPAQLAAYGVTTTAGGTLEQGRLAGSNVLNGLELEQIRARQALAQYNSVKPA